jgi:hypothetical protein
VVEEVAVAAVVEEGETEVLLDTLVLSILWIIMVVHSKTHKHTPGPSLAIDWIIGCNRCPSTGTTCNIML